MKKIKLTRGAFALVDDKDFIHLNRFKWSLGSHGYADRKEKCLETGKIKTILMHRFLIIDITNSHLDIDHINQNRIDNRRSNLRSCTRSENLMNRGKTKVNTSGYKGVTWDKAKNLWRAQIQVNKTNYYLGLFTTALEASIAYKTACKKMHKDFFKY